MSRDGWFEWKINCRPKKIGELIEVGDTATNVWFYYKFKVSTYYSSKLYWKILLRLLILCDFLKAWGIFSVNTYKYKFTEESTPDGNLQLNWQIIDVNKKVTGYIFLPGL